MDPRLLQIAAVRIAHRGLLVLTFARVLRGRVLELLCVPIQLFKLSQVVGTLAPVGQTMSFTQGRTDLDGLAHRIPQQINICRVMHMSFNHKGVTACGEAFRWTFFYQHVAGAHHFLIDPIEQLRRKQHQVILECLQLVLRLVGPVAVAQHLAQRAVLIGQFLNAVVVRIQAKAQHTEHENAPLLHSGASHAHIDLAFACCTVRKNFPQYGEDSPTQRRIGIDVLQPPQDLRDIVTRLRVQVDRADVRAVEQHLGVDYVAHGFSRNEVFGQTRYRRMRFTLRRQGFSMKSTTYKNLPAESARRSEIPRAHILPVTL